MHVYRTTRERFELTKKSSGNRKVFIRNLFILLFRVYLVVTLTRLKFLSALESVSMRYVYLSPEVRGMNYLQWRKRHLIKFDEEKSVLTFYRKRSVFACRYLFRYRCLCIPRHTLRTDNQASACVRIRFCMKRWLRGYWINVRVTTSKTCQSGWWVCAKIIFWNILIPILILVVQTGVLTVMIWNASEDIAHKCDLGLPK